MICYERKIADALFETLEITTQPFFVGTRGAAVGVGSDGVAKFWGQLGEPRLLFQIASLDVAVAWGLAALAVRGLSFGIVDAE